MQVSVQCVCAEWGERGSPSPRRSFAGARHELRGLFPNPYEEWGSTGGDACASGVRLALRRGLVEGWRVSLDPTLVYEVALRDGTPLLLRTISPQDRGRIAEAFRRLSPESAYFRFWTRVREINPRLIEQLCSPDHKDHVAWVALHRGRDDIPGVGGASFWRLAQDAEAAEVSITVADEYQGRGVATWLLALLWDHALSLGIRRFVGHVLNENVTMRAWWDALGATEEEGQRRWIMTLWLDEALLQETHAAESLRAALRVLRARRG